MAVAFAYRIHALTGFDADAGTASETGQYYRDMTAQWMTDAIVEVMNILPPQLLEKCSKISAASANYTNGTGVLNEGKVLSVIRTVSTQGTPTFNSGEVYMCRQIPYSQSFNAGDPDHVESATPTDPLYYIEPQVDNTVARVKVLPTSTAAIAKVISVDYPVFTAGDSGTYDVVNSTAIANFPDEAEYLVVLRAAIFAAQYQLAIEEDDDLYEPIIDSLSKKYEQGITALLTKKLEPAAKSKGKGLDLGKALAGLGGLGGAK
tara:strand:- start:519 stop:1304 length:786 start_codon:yes stop_codon:yes gene_type:complete